MEKTRAPKNVTVDMILMQPISKSWLNNSWAGYTVTNTTDDSSGGITANTATTITATLSGGTEDDWDDNDAYFIYSITGSGIPSEAVGIILTTKIDTIQGKPINPSLQTTLTTSVYLRN